MTRTTQRTFSISVAVTALALAACGGVDREGTRDQLIRDVAGQGGLVDGDCVDTVFEDYTDDDIIALSEVSSASEITPNIEQFQIDLQGCITYPDE